METCRLACRGHLPIAIHVCFDACIRILDSLSDPCGAEDGRNPEKVLHIITSELSVWLLAVRLESFSRDNFMHMALRTSPSHPVPLLRLGARCLTMLQVTFLFAILDAI